MAQPYLSRSPTKADPEMGHGCLVAFAVAGLCVLIISALFAGDQSSSEGFELSLFQLQLIGVVCALCPTILALRALWKRKWITRWEWVRLLLLLGLGVALILTVRMGWYVNSELLTTQSVYGAMGLLLAFCLLYLLAECAWKRTFATEHRVTGFVLLLPVLFCWWMVHHANVRAQRLRDVSSRDPVRVARPKSAQPHEGSDR